MFLLISLSSDNGYCVHLSLISPSRLFTMSQHKHAKVARSCLATCVATYVAYV
jgi:hypothetical protein